MFFLLRVAFWLTIVLALLPTGSAQNGAQAKVGATDAMVAAGAAVSDMTSFCHRQPDACVVGAQAAVAIGQRAQAGARMVYDFINDHASHGGDTGTVTKVAAVRSPAPPASQSTLKPSDLEPAWQGPPAHSENVPLPRPRARTDTHRKA
jgi:uncharacterized protein DUF5330